MGIILDTNILVYRTDETSNFHKNVKTFINNNISNLIIPLQVIFEFSAVLSKKGVRLNDIDMRIKKLRDDFEIVNLQVKDINIFFNLLDKYNLRGNRIYDAVIVATAIANEITKIATFDEDFKKYTEIEIIDI